VEAKVIGSDRVFSFVRENSKEKIFVVLNFSGETQKVSFKPGPQNGSYIELLKGTYFVCEDNTQLEIEPWGYRVFGLKK